MNSITNPSWYATQWCSQCSWWEKIDIKRVAQSTQPPTTPPTVDPSWRCQHVLCIPVPRRKPFVDPHWLWRLDQTCIVTGHSWLLIVNCARHYLGGLKKGNGMKGQMKKAEWNQYVWSGVLIWIWCTNVCKGFEQTVFQTTSLRQWFQNKTSVKQSKVCQINMCWKITSAHHDIIEIMASLPKSIFFTWGFVAFAVLIHPKGPNMDAAFPSIFGRWSKHRYHCDPSKRAKYWIVSCCGKGSPVTTFQSTHHCAIFSSCWWMVRHASLHRWLNSST